MGASIQEGTTNVSVVVKVIDATTGIPDQSLTFTDFAYWYRREVDPGSTPLAVQDTFTEVTQTVTGSHVDHGIVHLEEGNYRIDVPDAAFAAGAIAVKVGAVITGKIVIEADHPIVVAPLTATQVNAQVVDVMKTDTRSTDGLPAAPGEAESMETMITYIYKFLRNKKDATNSLIRIFDDAGTTADHKRTISDDDVTYVEEEVVAGP